MVKSEKKTSSSGEVSAITGYFRQYEYSACVLYSLMQEGILEAITIADPSAGIFDDLVVHSNGVVRATQVKSQKDGTYVSLGTELKAPFIQAMTKSWLKLEQKFGVGRVRLSYIFAGYFSISDTTLANANTTGARHSAEFARFVSRQDHSLEMWQSSIWSAKLTELQVLSGLDATTFIRFVNDLDLKDGRELQENRIDVFPIRERAKVEALRGLFPVLIASSSLGQRWSEQDLIDKLGWRNRLSQHNVHVFPVPTDFQDNEATERKLLDSIDQISRGYLALVGPPGTGKSTLLQRCIYSTPAYSVSRYLAFHPDQRHGLGRAEAGEFLNDLIAELKTQGFYGSKFAEDNLSGSRAEFAKQLESASERFRDTGRKTIIIVDGLDHVPREESPQESFLAELPAAAAVPDGIIFLLGTQRLELPRLHPTIIQQAKGQLRTVVIDPLSRSAVFALAGDAGLSDFIDREALFDACQGHPLTARYFIEALRGAVSADEATQILSHVDGLGQSLQEIYERVWLKLGTAKSSQRALGVLARAEGALSLQQLAQASNDDAVEDILKSAGFLLAHTSDGLIAIFHNSFRLFVAAETGKKFGAPSATIETDYQRCLAEIAQSAAEVDPQHWFELRYRSRAGDNPAVLSLGTPDYFRRSLRVFRPSGEIYADLRLAYAAVRPTGNRVLLLNKLLVAKEIEYRLEAVSELDFVDLLFDLGDVELATRHALEIGCTGEGWLRLVDHYWHNGDRDLARQIFEANEPIEILFAKEGFDPYLDMKKALRWIQRAQRFRPIKKVSAIVDSLAVQTRALAADDGGADARRTLKYNLALGVVNDRGFGEVGALQDALALNDEEVLRLTIEAAEQACQRGENEKVLELLRKAEAMPALKELHQSWCRAMGLIAYEIGESDLARRMTASLSIARFDRYEIAQENMDDVTRAIIETAFLAEATATTVPEELQDDHGDPSTLLSAAHIKMRELGTLAATAKSGDPTVSVRALKTIVMFFARAKPSPGDFRAYRFLRSFGELGQRVVSIAYDLGNSYFRDIVEFVDDQVEQGNTNFAGSDAFRLKFAACVFDIDRDVEAARKRIERTQAAAHHDRTPQEAVESRAKLARAFSHVGLQNEARSTLQSMHQDTFGYWLRAKKEPQYTFWAWSFLKACEASPLRAEANSLTFAQFVLGMDETEGDETAARLVADLLQGAGAHPGAAAGISSRLMDSDLATWAKIADSALASIVMHAPNLAPSVLLAFSRLVVPFIHNDIDRCLRVCLEVMGPAERARPLELLLFSVSRWCPPSRRQSLLEKVKELAPEAKGLVATVLSEAINVAARLEKVAHGENRNSQGTSYDGVSLDIEVENLEELLAHGDGKSDYGEGVDYSYARAAERLIAGSSKAQIVHFMERRSHLERDAKLLTAISRRMLALGDRAAAVRYFAKAERAAYSGYWSSFMGGEKLALQRARIELEGEGAYARGFDVLVGELSGGQVSGSSLFLNLEDVLELVADNIPYEQFWIETENHLKQYREFRFAQPVQSIASVQTHTDFLAFLVAKAFDFSCPELLRHARATATLVARQEAGAAFTQSLFGFLQEQSEGRREAAALMDRLRDAPHLREVLTDKATIDVTSDDFIVANLAKRVLVDLGSPFEEPPFKPLPAFYELVTEKSDQDHNFDPPPGLDPGRRPVWSDDPWTWTLSLWRPFQLLTAGCYAPLGLLRRRCARFMAEEGGRGAFGPEAEEAIVAKLRRMHLRFPYRRPMAMAALRAFSKLLQELDVADQVDSRMFPTIWADIGGPALSGPLPECDPRPLWIATPPVPVRQYGGVDQDEWLLRSYDELSIPFLLDYFVLAEHTYSRVKALRASASSSKLVLPSTADVGRGIDGLPSILSIDSPVPVYQKEDSKLVCRVQADLYGDLKRSAITICPYVAHSLGWVRSAWSPFVFVDSNREIVAQTIFWTDGTNAEGGYDAELFGAGQALLITWPGKAQLEGRYGLLSVGVKVERNIVDESRRTDRRTTLAPT
ncbi:AAA family ATPase [Bradyrhizobium manausense]|uniref:AAA family ATPase n=1 Tax=Bradyrhizobium manausense TaxID=989370 RepID=UPI001BAB64EF|nr:ATP-binding protein [Bradyrhizobium manausense]MBR0725706.1 ATP-binding protein [Bradyrhizobium manausense]